MDGEEIKLPPKMDEGFPGGTSGKESACQCRGHKRHRFDPWVRTIPWRRAWQPAPVVLPRESLGQKSLAGCSPQGRAESDTTEGTQHARTRWMNCASDRPRQRVGLIVAVSLYRKALGTVLDIMSYKHQGHIQMRMLVTAGEQRC